MSSPDQLPVLLDSLRSGSDPKRTWRAMLDLLADSDPSPLWVALAEPTLERDVARARQWLVDDLGRRDAPKPARGVYFGIDLRSMHGPAGFNVDMNATRGADPDHPDRLWVWNCEWRGRRHRIEGLRLMCETAHAPEYASAHALACSTLPLAYAGLVLATAVSELEVSTPLLAVYGLHDGDLYALARRTPYDVEILATPLVDP